MSITITSKLNQAAQTFPAGESTGFGLRLGVQFYNRKTKQKEWTNYQAAIFSRNPQQIQFLTNTLVEGAVVEVTAKTQFIDSFQGNNGTVSFIQLNDCDLGYIHTPQGQSAPQQNQAPQQPQNQNPGHTVTQQQAPSGFDDFEDDQGIPF